MVSSLSTVSSAASLASSVEAALKRAQAQSAGTGASADAPAGKVQEYRQDTRKSSANAPGFATDIGTLTKDVSRLNVFSTLAGKDPADFYKFKVATKGEAVLRQVGDAGVRSQILDRTGRVIADSDKSAGGAHENYQKLSRGEMTIDRGDYTLRVSRDRDVPLKEAKNYAFQLRMGSYAKDYDTVAKEPRPGDSPVQLPSYIQGLQSLLMGVDSARNGMLSGNPVASRKGALFDGLF